MSDSVLSAILQAWPKRLVSRLMTLWRGPASQIRAISVPTDDPMSNRVEFFVGIPDESRGQERIGDKD